MTFHSFFWAEALLAFLVGDIALGVRISDALLPMLAAIPTYLILKSGEQVWLPALGVLVVLLHPVQLFFTGYFIKNAAAMPLFPGMDFADLARSQISVVFASPGPQSSKPDEKPPVASQADKAAGAEEIVYQKGKVTITRVR